MRNDSLASLALTPARNTQGSKLPYEVLADSASPQSVEARRLQADAAGAAGATVPVGAPDTGTRADAVASNDVAHCDVASARCFFDETCKRLDISLKSAGLMLSAALVNSLSSQRDSVSPKVWGYLNANVYSKDEDGKDVPKKPDKPVNAKIVKLNGLNFPTESEELCVAESLVVPLRKDRTVTQVPCHE